MDEIIIYAGNTLKNSYRLKIIKKKEFYFALETMSIHHNATEDTLRKNLANWETNGLIKIRPLKCTIVHANRYCCS